MEGIRINLICLAAGYSRRFGANKLLLKLDGQPLFTYGMSAVLELKRLLEQPSPVQEENAIRGGSECGENIFCDTRIQIAAFPLVVTAYDEIELWCEKHGVSCIRNNPPENTGMASSIQKAIAFCKTQEAYGFREEIQTDTDESVCAGMDPCYDMYFTADQPNLDAKVLARFIRLYLMQERSIGALLYDGILRSPGIFEKKWRNDFGTLTGDEGGKHIRKSHPEDIFTYPVERGEMFADVDTPSDVHKLDNKVQI